MLSEGQRVGFMQETVEKGLLGKTGEKCGLGASLCVLSYLLVSSLCSTLAVMDRLRRTCRRTAAECVEETTPAVKLSKETSLVAQRNKV